MLPLLLDISESLKLTGGNGQQALFVPGESVQATVLEILEPGRFLILVKGTTLNASSLAGPLGPGQVLQARVERTGGQIFLKLEQPIPAKDLQQLLLTGKGSQPQSDGSRAQALRLSAHAAGFPSQVAASLPESSVYTKEIGKLGQAEASNPLAPVQVEGLISQGQRGTEQPEVVKQPEATEQTEPTIRGRENNANVPLVRQPAAQSSQSNGESASPVTLGNGPAEAERSKRVLMDQPLGLSRPAQALTAAHANDPDPISQLLRTLLPADESFGSSLTRLLSSIRTAVQREILPEQVGEGLEKLHERLVLNGDEPSGLRVKEAVLAKGLQYEQSLLPLLEKGEAGGTEVIEPTLKGWLLATLATYAKRVAIHSGEGTPLEETPPPGPTQGTTQESLADWMKDARHMLRVIEREQVINSLNVPRGQPLLVEVPLGPWAESSAYLYVSRVGGDEGKQQHRQTRRPYSVVTLLELDGIGPIRVDALLTGKRIAARVLVERPEIERAAAALLPILNKRLRDRGYQVETLAASVAEPGMIRGEDLRTRTVPALSLVNVRA